MTCSTRISPGASAGPITGNTRSSWKRKTRGDWTGCIRSCCIIILKAMLPKRLSSSEWRWRENRWMHSAPMTRCARHEPSWISFGRKRGRRWKAKCTFCWQEGTACPETRKQRCANLKPRFAHSKKRRKQLVSLLLPYSLPKQHGKDGGWRKQGDGWNAAWR